LGRGLSLLILGKIIAKIADLGSKEAGLSSDFWENCMISKKIIGVCYILKKITGFEVLKVHFKIYMYK
jgi:hypothetical protein